MKSAMTNTFAQVPKVEIPRSTFMRPSNLKTTFNAGQLIPIYFDEVLPGDTHNVTENLFGRLNTPIFPIMDNVYLDTFYFFVPNRLVWDNWQRFMGEEPNPGDSTDYLIPQVNKLSGWGSASIADYFGIAIGVPNTPINSLAFRAYNLIWNEWFRDQNLQNRAPVPKGDGPDTDTDFTIRKRGKRHDYFTSCLPFPQKGPDVVLPLAGSAPVERQSNANPWFAYQAGTNTLASGTLAASAPGANLGRLNNGTVPLSLDPNDSLYTDLADAAGTINALREAFQLQRLFERDARGGTRYIEILRSHFGVISPDARLQRPEYLGGSSVRININPVAQTSETGTSPQGNLAAFGTVSSTGRGFAYSAVEHGMIIGLACVRADLSYQQNIDRGWTRRTRYDFYWPSLAHLGEQAVLNREIFAAGTTADSEVFGYQERWAEYRYKTSQICGKFRSDAAGTIDQWHLAQDFLTKPVLGPSFIEENPPMSRIMAVPSEPDIILDAYFMNRTARPMPMYSVPGMADHF